MGPDVPALLDARRPAWRLSAWRWRPVPPLHGSPSAVTAGKYLAAVMARDGSALPVDVYDAVTGWCGEAFESEAAALVGLLVGRLVTGCFVGASGHG